MHRSPTGNLVPLDLEIEATLRRNRVERRRKLLQDRTVAVHQSTKKSLLELSSHDALLAQNKLLSRQLEILTETLGKLRVVPSVVRLMKQANVFPLKKTLKKFTIWEINRDKDILKKDSQASSRVLIINKDSGDHTLTINSTKTRVTMSNHKSTESALKILEVQVGQLAKQIADKSSNSFMANTKKNPKEECKVVMTRSKRFMEAEDEDSVVSKKKAAEKKGTDEKKVEVIGERNQEKEKQIMVKKKELNDQEREKEMEKEKENEKIEKDEKNKNEDRSRSEQAREKKREKVVNEGAEVPYPVMVSRKRARADDIPSSSTPAPPSATIGPDVQSSQTLVPMLQSLFRAQFIIMHSLPIIPMEHFLEQVAWPGAQPPLVRPNEAAPPEPTPARVEPVPADPQSPVVNPPSSPKLEVVPPSPSLNIISDSPSGEAFTYLCIVDTSLFILGTYSLNIALPSNTSSPRVRYSILTVLFYLCDPVHLSGSNRHQLKKSEYRSILILSSKIQCWYKTF
ncbi:hypothetical protein HKD37_07G019550 [Glycine soja]